MRQNMAIWMNLRMQRTNRLLVHFCRELHYTHLHKELQTENQRGTQQHCYKGEKLAHLHNQNIAFNNLIIAGSIPGCH